MVSGTISRVVIVDDGMYQGRGIVINWVRRVTNSFARSARELAPMRSGRLRAGIHQGTPRNPLRKVVQGTISSHAPHTMYVLRGTTGPIMSDALWALGGVVPHRAEQPRVMRRPGRGGKPHLVRTSPPGLKMAVGRNLYPPETPMFVVRGQAANNFMLKAWVVTGTKHSAIAGVSFPIPMRAR